MSAHQTLQLLASYVPDLIIRRIARNPVPVREPNSENFRSILLFADISGFTPLTERLAQKGPLGIEQLNHILQDYFGKLIDILRHYGGDIFRFAGDGLIAIWPEEQDDTDLPTLAHQALTCSQIIQETLHNYETEDGTLSLKIALSAGDVFVAQLGGVFNRWEFFIAGEAMNEVGLAETQASPGQIILGSSMWELVGDLCEAEEFAPGFYRLIAAQPVDQPLARPRPPLSPEMEPGLRAYIPGVVLNRLSVMQSGFLPEMRNVTIIFINLPNLADNLSLEQAHQVFRSLQTVLYRYEGSVNTINVDEKGVNLVCVLGLPPFSHEDDPARGVLAALEMRARLQQSGWQSSIGISSGRVLCGTIGSETRQEYNLTGNAINLAARLMQAASGDILCDVETYRSARNQVAFEELAPIRVKGRREKVAIYRPLGPSEASVRPAIEIVGRKRERTQIAAQLQRMLRGGKGGVTVIEGEAGIGKSRLVDFVLEQAKTLGIPTLLGAGRAIEQGSRYHAWEPVFRQIFDLDARSLDANGSHETLKNRILSQLQNDQELLRLAPLLNEVLPLQWEDNELTAEMDGEVRANNTRTLLVRVLQNYVAQSPKVLILEDAHWLDSASWSLALEVAQQVPEMGMYIVSRRFTGPTPPEYTRLIHLAGERYLRLEALPADDTEQLICQRLGVRSLPEAVCRLIHERAEGHPFFSEELAFALRDAGYIEIVDGECRLAPGIDLEAVPFPRTIEGVITRRIDRLSTEQQLAIKVASVIGRLFALSILVAIFPVDEQKPLLAQYIQELEEYDLILSEWSESDLRYVFKHIITQEVAYNLMLFSQRKELHHNVAEWYERTYADNLAPYYPLLAYHWVNANGVEKALYYLSKAAEQALQSFANQEALNFLNQALELDAKNGYPTDTAIRARWLLQIGRAHVGLGRLSEARQNLENGLALIGEYVPGSSFQAILHLLKELIRRAGSRLPGKKWMGRNPPEAVRSDLLLALERLGELYYYVNQPAYMLYYDMRLLHLAEAYGAYPEMARAYGTLSAVMGIAMLHPVARSFRLRAQQAAAKSRQLNAETWVHLTSGLYSASIGEWQASKAYLLKGERASETLGDLRRQGQNITLLIETLYHMGEFEQGVQWGEKALPLARKRDDAQAVGYALLGQIENLLALGETETAFQKMDELLPLLEQIGQADVNMMIYTYGLLAAVHARQGVWQRAYSRAQQASHALANTRPNSHFIIEGYAGVVEAFLRLWEAGETNGLTDEQTAGLPKDARKVMRSLRLFAFTFPIGKPYLERWNGLYHWLSGRPKKALKSWQKSLAAARQLNMTYQEGITLLEIARHLPPGHPQRREYLHQASSIFERLGARPLLDAARQMAGG